MSVTTVSNAYNPAAEKASRGFFGRLADRIMAGRMREAERRVAYHMLALDDVTLKELGYDREELSKISATASY
ncbi:MAG: hypothetical protein AAGA88_02955 [Pseudomonadota bacterium]